MRNIIVFLLKFKAFSSWRQRLQELIHCAERFLGSPSLNYNIQLSALEASGKNLSVDIASQTALSNPNSDRILEFVRPKFELKWVLDKADFS